LHNFDVIVTDLKMETATAGFSVLRAAKAKDVTTQVIVLTAYGKPEVKAESMVLGAFDYLETSRSDEKTTIGGIFEVIRDKISSALCFRAKLAASTVLPQDEVGNG
jgi:DNA-binding NtrC family response regulator